MFGRLWHFPCHLSGAYYSAVMVGVGRCCSCCCKRCCSSRIRRCRGMYGWRVSRFFGSYVRCCCLMTIDVLWRTSSPIHFQMSRCLWARLSCWYPKHRIVWADSELHWLHFCVVGAGVLLRDLRRRCSPMQFPIHRRLHSRPDS